MSETDAQRSILARAESAERFLCEDAKMTQDPFPDEIQQVTVPDLGIENRPVSLVNWLVPPDAKVIAGERIAELLVDSTLFHLESEHNGRLKKYLVPSGVVVQTGDFIAEIEVQEADTY